MHQYILCVCLLYVDFIILFQCVWEGAIGKECLAQSGWRGNGDTERKRGRGTALAVALWTTERLREREPGNRRAELGSGCVQQRVCQRQERSEERKSEQMEGERIWGRAGEWRVANTRKKQKVKSESWSNLRKEACKSWPQNQLVSCFCGAGILIFMWCLDCVSVFAAISIYFTCCVCVTH